MLQNFTQLNLNKERSDFQKLLSLIVLSLIIFSFTFVRSVHAGEVTLAWDANTDQNLAGYKIYFGISSKNYQGSVDVGNVTNYTLSNLADGEVYYFAATAYDVYGHESDYSVELAQVVNNQSPVVSAGPDQEVSGGQTVALVGSNSYDLDGGIVSYAWVQTGGTGVEIADPNAADTSFTAPYVGTTGESLTFMLTVTDIFGAQAKGTCTVNVISANRPPVAVAGLGQTVSEWKSVLLDGSKSYDPDDGIASYAWRQIAGPGVNLYDADMDSPIFVAPDVGPDGMSLTFQLTVTDFSGLQSTDTCVVNVVWINSPPVADAGRDQMAKAGSTAKLNGFASSDPDDGISSYQWTQIAGDPVELSDPSSAQATLKVPKVKRGTVLTFRLTVEDWARLSSSDTCDVIVK